jgi:uncharacterized protein
MRIIGVPARPGARGWAILTGVALLAACGSAHARDCARPRLPAEYVICKHKSLERLFDRRRQAYQAARARSNKAEKKALAGDDRRWLRSYQAACGIAARSGLPVIDDRAIVQCFARAFTARIAWLRDYPPTAAALSPVAPALRRIVRNPRQEQPKPATRGAVSVHREFTFACRTPAQLMRVLHALAANDLDYPLNQPDCLPLIKGRQAQLIAMDGKFAKIRLCSPDAGCTEVYADARSLIDDGGAPAPDEPASRDRGKPAK